MAYVQPNSIVQLFKGINLDNRYLHTIYFANTSTQNSWFSSKVFETYQQISYVRYTKNQIKLKADATSLFGVTYMRFMNDRTADKWFYAFVNNIEYLNENTALITYEIDVMQTWFIQVGSVRPCMVLREHTNNDDIFENLEAEPVGSDVYEHNYITDANTLGGGASSESDNIFKDYSVCVTTTGKSSTGYYKEGIFDGTKHDSIRCNDTTEAGDVVEYLDGLLGSWDAGQQDQEIISMITFPSRFADQTYSDVLAPLTKTVNGVNTIGGGGTVVSGYVPKNKKLFSYPYNYLYCTTHDGNSAIYKWELFDNGGITNRITNKTFKIAGSSVGSGQIKCYPLNYDGMEEAYEDGVTMSNFPKNAFNYDAYQAWVAAGGKTRLENDETITNLRAISTGLNAANTTVQTVGKGAEGVLLTMAGIMTNQPNVAAQGGAQTFGAITNSATSILDATADIMEAKNKISYQWNDAYYRPNKPVGESAPSVMVGGRLLNFYFYEVHIKLSELKRIDDFFSVFGYKTDRVKAPNLNGRQYWNFVQTQNCVIAGDMPASSKEAIGRIFDGGITFWHNGDNIGNYRLSVTNDTINNPII